MRLAGLLFIVFVALLTQGCASVTGGYGAKALPLTQEFAFPLTVIGDNGVSVTFTEPPARIISLSPGHTEILYAIGAAELLVGADDFSDYPEEARSLPKVGYAQVNLEQVIELNPDLIIAVTRQKAAVPEMERLGLKALYLTEATTLDGILDRIQTIGKITNRQESANQLVNHMRLRIQSVVSKIGQHQDRPTVFYELSPQYHTVGDRSFIGDILRKLNVRNVGSDIDGTFPQLSSEQIIAANPDFIVLADPVGVTAESVRERPGWESLTAVRNGSLIMFHNRDIINRPGPRVVEGLEFLAIAIYGR